MKHTRVYNFFKRADAERLSKAMKLVGIENYVAFDYMYTKAFTILVYSVITWGDAPRDYNEERFGEIVVRHNTEPDHDYIV